MHLMIVIKAGSGLELAGESGPTCESVVVGLNSCRVSGQAISNGEPKQEDLVECLELSQL